MSGSDIRCLKWNGVMNVCRKCSSRIVLHEIPLLLGKPGLHPCAELLVHSSGLGLEQAVKGGDHLLVYVLERLSAL